VEEKTLTATALLFAIYLIKPAPFCILDEVDAPLDDANVGKFTNMIKKFSENSQFIIVTHNKQTMSAVDVIYGVTMQEAGVSKLVPVDLKSELIVLFHILFYKRRSCSAFYNAVLEARTPKTAQ
jgi:chromosome segregation protein